MKITEQTTYFNTDHGAGDYRGSSYIPHTTLSVELLPYEVENLQKAIAFYVSNVNSGFFLKNLAERLALFVESRKKTT